MTVYIQYSGSSHKRLYVNTPNIDSSRKQLLCSIVYCCLYFDKVHHPSNNVHASLTVIVSQCRHNQVCVITGIIISRQLKVGTLKQTCAYSSTYLSTCVKTCVYWEQTCGSPVDYIWLVFNSAHTRNNTPHPRHANAAVHHFYSTPDTWSQLLSGFFKGWP